MEMGCNIEDQIIQDEADEGRDFEEINDKMEAMIKF